MRNARDRYAALTPAAKSIAIGYFALNGVLGAGLLYALVVYTPAGILERESGPLPAGSLQTQSVPTRVCRSLCVRGEPEIDAVRPARTLLSHRRQSPLFRSISPTAHPLTDYVVSTPDRVWHLHHPLRVRLWTTDRLAHRCVGLLRRRTRFLCSRSLHPFAPLCVAPLARQGFYRSFSCGARKGIPSRALDSLVSRIELSSIFKLTHTRA